MKSSHRNRYTALRWRLKSLVRSNLRRLGLELSRFRPATSELARIQRMLRHHHVDLILDVGANIGQFATLMREIGYDGDIVSYEPLSDAHAVLEKTSRSDPRWTVERTAIGDHDGRIEINVSQNAYSSSILDVSEAHLRHEPDAAAIKKETVPLGRLDTVASGIVSSHSCVFLKIDTQGYEHQVLQGASGILEKIKLIELELSLVPLYHGQKLYKEMISLVEQEGFSLFSLCPGISDPDSGALLQMDGIFVRQD